MASGGKACPPITTRPPGLIVESVGARLGPVPLNARASVSSGKAPIVDTTPVAVLMVTSRVFGQQYGVTQGFGESGEQGADFATPEGTPVFAG